ncbi:MAG TPA: rRNA adenine dimethyltransferase family protein [Candidatus Saccharimonadales bacterium]
MSRLHSYSQHFLKSPRLVAELIGHSNIRKNDVVYDLGAGSGVIASVLARRAKQVLAVEIEPSSLKKLRENMADFDNVKVLEEDILTISPPEGRYKIFANIPFNLSANTVRKFAFAENPPTSIYLVVQKQFAWKLTPSDRRFNSLLGAQLWPWYQVRVRKPLRKTDFTPPPGVDTVLLEIKPLEESLLPREESVKYREFVAKCFELQKFFTALDRESVGISSERKPSELKPDEWVRLFRSN